MSNTQTGQQVIAKTPPPLIPGNRVDFNKSIFDQVVYEKGYKVYVDKAISCPCANLGDNQALSSCRNCGGSRYVYINRFSTQIVLQAMNIDTKFKEWSQEMIGTVKITTLNSDRLSLMDRIIVREAESITTEIIHGKRHADGFYRQKTIYPLVSIEAAFIFNGETNKLIHAIEGVHFEIEDENWIKFKDPYNFDLVTMTLRYVHRPMYYVMDNTRNVMVTSVESEVNPASLPLHAIGRLAHYWLDQQKLNGEYLFNNNFESEDCSTQYENQCN